MYTEVAENLIRFYGYTIEQIDRITLPEYELLMKTAELISVDKADDIHQIAWLSVAAGATKKDGKPVYTQYVKFFDKENELAQLKKKRKKIKEGRFNRLSRHLKDKDNGNK